MRRRKSNRNKYLLIAILLLIVVIVAAFAVSQTNSKKPSASQYFIVTHTASIGTFESDNKSVTLTVLGLNITAVGGDATGVYVRCKSQASPVDDYIQTLPKGPPGWDLQVSLTGGDYQYHGLYVRVDSQGMFDVNVTVSCNEAESAIFTVPINPQDIVAV